MRNDRGEVSIPAILIVIILIVFVGVCIFMLTGENGVFIPKGYEQNVENNTNTNAESTNKTENKEQNKVTQNVENALTVPMQ